MVASYHFWAGPHTVQSIASVVGHTNPDYTYDDLGYLAI
jgi:hypothetical protein